MSLAKYKEKRDFNSTPEPEGKIKKTGDQKLTFVIHRHKASHLNYDFRLEMKGVLVSWAVPKGPSMNPADKRLAMKVEDHPLDYGTFEGEIPSGYGAGIVEIWDHGTYEHVSQPEFSKAEKLLSAGLKKGDLKITLHGRKLKGEFAIVKFGDPDKNTWLLIKHKDQYAVSIEYDSEELTSKSSPINMALKKK